MIKKTPVGQLRIGMYISDMNAGWLSHPFLLNRLMIENEGQIAAIREAGVREVYIDTDKGLDAPDAPSAAEAAAATEAEIRGSITEEKAPRPSRASLQEEFARARRIYADATSMVREVMQDVRLGQPLGLERAQLVADRLVGSVLRNGSALIVVCRLRQYDEYTFRHSVNVSVLLVNVARTLGADMTTLRELSLGGLIHDVGKMLVKPELLNKPGRLTAEEFDHLRSHVDCGSRLVRLTEGVPVNALAVLEQHHERFDGSGYPCGYQGEGISQAGRMAALCDVYDAITSDRCYHDALSPAEGMRRVFEWSKHHFDPDITRAFVRSIGIYPVGSLVRLNNGQLAVVKEQREAALLRPVVRVIFDTRHQHYVPPRSVDLSRREGEKYQILGHEDPLRWGIDVGQFLV